MRASVLVGNRTPIARNRNGQNNYMMGVMLLFGCIAFALAIYLLFLSNVNWAWNEDQDDRDTIIGQDIEGLQSKDMTLMDQLAEINNTLSQRIDELDNNVVKTINGQSSVGFNNNILVSGTGGTTIGTGPGSNEITVNTTMLEMSINNVDMTASMNSNDIMDLKDKDMILMDQINALNMTGQMIQAALNGTTIDFNMTIEELIMDVLMLMNQVSTLQDQINNLTMQVPPTGQMAPWAGTTAMVPDGWLLCDGSVVNQGDYPELFVAIGTAYCDPPCAMGTFQLPDLRTRVPVGMQGGDPNFGMRGQKSGASSHTLSVMELPMHTHGGSGLSVGGGGGHDHDETLLVYSDGFREDDKGTNDGALDPIFTTSTYTAGSPPTVTTPSGAYVPRPGEPGIQCNAGMDRCVNGWLPRISEMVYRPNVEDTLAQSLRPRNNGAHSHTVTGTTGSTGSNTPHNIVQPSVAVGGYIIKT